MKNRIYLSFLDQTFEQEKNANDQCVIYWNKRGIRPDHYSLPEIIERDYLCLQAEYVAFIYQLSHYQIRKKTIIEHLKLEQNFSYWWMTLLSEKSPIKSPEIDQVLKLRCLEKLLLQLEFDEIYLIGHEPHLKTILAKWLKGMNKKLIHHQPLRHLKNYYQNLYKIKKLLKEKVPFCLQACYYFYSRYLIRYLLIKQQNPYLNKVHLQNNAAKIFVYMPYYSLENSSEGKDQSFHHFISRYLERLHQYLLQSSRPIDWFWIYSGSCLQKFKECLSLRKKLNHQNNRYFMLEDFLSLKILTKMMMTYLRIYFKGSMLTPFKQAFQFEVGQINYYPLMKISWQQSLFGHYAIQNTFFIHTFQQLIQQFPVNSWGLYIWENQTWEMALIHYWKKNSTHQLVGYQHATVTPLDLRNFCDAREFKQQQQLFTHPLPSLLATNGKASTELLLNSGYESHLIKPVEAVRYEFLNDLKILYQQKKEFHLNSLLESHSINSSNKKKLLVLTGHNEEDNAFQLELLNQVIKKYQLNDYLIYYRPHPFYSINHLIKNYLVKVEYQISREPISQILHQFDVAYCTYSSSVCIEVAWVGLPIIFSAPKNGLNLCPLLGKEKITFCSTDQELYQELQNPPLIAIQEGFFHIHPETKIFSKLLDQLQ